MIHSRIAKPAVIGWGAIALAALGSLVLQSCGGGYSTVPAPVRATPEVGVLTFLVDNPEIRDSGNDPRCAAVNKIALQQTFKRHVQKELISLGVKVVGDETHRHELRLRIWIDMGACTPDHVPVYSDAVGVVEDASGKRFTVVRSKTRRYIKIEGVNQKYHSLSKSRSIAILAQGLARRVVGSRGLTDFLLDLRLKNPNYVMASSSPTTGGFSGVSAAGAAAQMDGAFVQAAPQPKAYAVVVGLETYRDVPPAAGAVTDAKRFAALAQATLGVPQEQIVLAVGERATRSDILKHLDWLKRNVPHGGRVYFYFSGHGAPEPASGTSYLLPFDGDPSALERTAIRVSDVLSALSKTSAKEVIVFVDACFSGAGGRSVLAAGVRPLVRVKKSKQAPKVALFTAATGAEISGAHPEGGGGLFTTMLVEALGAGAADENGDGKISLKELVDWIQPRVSKIANQFNWKQTPTLSADKKLGSLKNIIIASGIGTSQ